ncbi:MAG: hypothetical protein KDC52_01120 [Ignavibacteriae bacterium]|nr:hypothetical protein [Ignavibacteriota bacterium]MCB0750053.1 hypothetical protein [Ignavibacteriota bacterium]
MFSEIKVISFLRYIAHLFSILLIFVVLLLALGENFKSIEKLTLQELLLISSFIIMFVGLLSAWKWEFFGGLLIIIGFAMFYIVNSLYAKNLNLGFFFVLFPLTGLIFIFCCWREKRLTN